MRFSLIDRGAQIHCYFCDGCHMAGQKGDDLIARSRKSGIRGPKMPAYKDQWKTGKAEIPLPGNQGRRAWAGRRPMVEVP